MNMTLAMLVCVAGVIIPGILALLILGNPLLSMAISLSALLIEIPCVYLVVIIWPQQRELKRRLNRVAAALKGGTLLDASTGDSVSVFRAQRSKSRLVERLEHKFPMLEVRKTLPKAVGLGVLGAVAAGLGAAFIGFGLLAILFLLPVSGLGCSWAMLAMQDAGQRNEFTKIFPETTDQVVRLVRAGVPSMEAISIVAQEAPPPVVRDHARNSLGGGGRTGPGNRHSQRCGARSYSRVLPLLCRSLLADDDRRRHFGRARQSFDYSARPLRYHAQGQEFDGSDPADPGNHLAGADRGAGHPELYQSADH